jgi:hypothetical protein
MNGVIFKLPEICKLILIYLTVNIINSLRYSNNNLLQSALQPLVEFRPAQLSLTSLSGKVLQSAVASGTSNPQLGGDSNNNNNNYYYYYKSVL